MTTARDIVVAALEDVGVLGVGQTPLAEDVSFGLVRLNRMIAQFNRRRWLVFHLMDGTCMTNGNNYFTIGPNGNINVPIRPDKLEDGCFFRSLNGAPATPAGGDFNADFNSDFSGGGGAPVTLSGNPIDYPLELIEARETYNLIAMKQLASWPTYVYYDAAFPLGKAYIYPVPYAGQFELHLLIKTVLPTLTNLSTELAVPPEYEEAFEYNLALRFFAKYQIMPDPTVVGLARAALATIRAANTQVPLLQMPDRLVGNDGRYNVYSDRSY